jgi:peptide chain release factor 2
MRERTSLEDQINGIVKLERDLDDALTLIELGEMEEDEASITEGEVAIKAVEVEAARRQVETLLSGEADMLDTYLEIHPGAGGTESQDWAEMLLRMYRRWGERASSRSRRSNIRTATPPASNRRPCSSRATTPMAG